MSVNSVLSRKVKTRSIISVAAVSLFLFSTGAMAVNVGPACNLPGAGLTAAQWAQNQDNAGGHMTVCHVGKADAWLQQRTVANQPSCPQTNTASTWTDADAAWNSIGNTIQAFCAGATNNTAAVNFTIALGGNGTVNVGRAYGNGAFYNIANDRQAFIRLVNNGGQWRVQTSYPRN